MERTGDGHLERESLGGGGFSRAERYSETRPDTVELIAEHTAKEWSCRLIELV